MKEQTTGGQNGKRCNLLERAVTVEDSEIEGKFIVLVEESDEHTRAFLMMEDMCGK